MKIDLTGKIALITGASKGLGAYYASVLSDNGATVIVTGRSATEGKLDAVVNNITAKGKQAASIILDMTEFNSFDSKIRSIVDQFGAIDILVNNTAVSMDKDFFDITHHDWDLHLDLI